MTSTCNCPIDLCQLSFPAFSSPEPLGLICNERPRDQETTGSGDENGFPPHWTPSLNTPPTKEASENPEVNPEVECKAVLSGKGGISYKYSYEIPFTSERHSILHIRPVCQ